MITVIGSINLDLIASVERLPGPGETVPGDGFRSAPGGKGANQALAARRAGSEVAMVGAVGADPFADQALALLREGGVELTGVAVSGQPTGTALILVGTNGENMIAVVPGANGEVDKEAVDAASFASGGILLLQHEIPPQSIERALVRARQTGTRSILNTAPYRADCTDLLAQADIVVANETEFDLYAQTLALEGAGPLRRMDDFVKKTGRTIVVTRGSQGVVAAMPDGTLKVPALAIEPVDTVGAGDTFCGYLGDGLARGLGLEAALRRAAVAGSLACLKSGAQPAIPTAEDVEARL